MERSNLPEGQQSKSVSWTEAIEISKGGFEEIEQRRAALAEREGRECDALCRDVEEDRDRLAAEVARVRADVAEEIARAIEAMDGRQVCAWTRAEAAGTARDFAVAPAESVVGPPTPISAPSDVAAPRDALTDQDFADLNETIAEVRDCPNCRRYGAPARVEHCGPGCHEAHTYVAPCELAVRALPEDEGTRQEGLINVEE